MRKRQMIVLVLLVIGLLASILGYVILRQDGVVKIGYQRTLLYLPVFVAEKKGFFTEQGVRVQLKEFGSANLMMQALLSKQIHATGMSALNVLATVEQEEPGQFKMFLFEVFTQDQHADHVLVPVSSTVSSLKGLKGKRIGVHPGTTIRMYAKAALRKFMDPDDEVEFVELAPSLQVQALATSQVDAVFGLEPVAATALAKGIARDIGGFIAEHTIDPAYPGSSAFSASFVKECPDRARKVEIAIYQALDWIRSNPKSAKEVLAEYLNLAPEILPRLSLIGWAKVKEVDRSKVQDLLDIYERFGVLKEKVTLESSYFRP